MDTTSPSFFLNLCDGFCFWSSVKVSNAALPQSPPSATILSLDDTLSVLHTLWVHFVLLVSSPFNPSHQAGVLEFFFLLLDHP